MSDDQIRLLIESMTDGIDQTDPKAVNVVNMLASETLKFRDKLQEDTGVVLTVGDVRVVLEALDTLTNTSIMPTDLTDEQKALVQILFDKLTVF